MDISNNYYGRKKGSSLKNYNNSYIGTSIANNISNGNLKRIRLYSKSICQEYQGLCTKYIGYYHKTSNEDVIIKENINMKKKIIMIITIFLSGVVSTLIFKSVTQVEILKTLDSKAFDCIHSMLDENSCYELAIQEVSDEIKGYPPEK